MHFKLYTIIALLIACFNANLINNVYFNQINRISVTKSRWTIKVFIDTSTYINQTRWLKNHLDRVTVILLESRGRFESNIGKGHYLTIHNHNKTAVSLSSGRLTDGRIYIRELDRMSSQLYNMKRATKALLAFFLDMHSLNIKKKRSLFPFVSSWGKYLFGFSTHRDLISLRKNIDLLKKNDERLRHVMTEAISFMNSRFEMSLGQLSVKFSTFTS